MAISNSKFGKLLCIHIDNKLKTEPHVRSQCKKASQILSAFVRIAHSLKYEQRKLLLNTFVTSQYSDVSVVWMSHNRKSNNHISRIHERALRIEYQSHISTIDERLAKDGFFKIQSLSLQKLCIEIPKVKTKFALES